MLATDGERCRVAIRTMTLGHKSLNQMDTLFRWHRKLVAQEWNFVHRRTPGWPRVKGEIAVLRPAVTRANHAERAVYLASWRAKSFALNPSNHSAAK